MSRKCLSKPTTKNVEFASFYRCTICQKSFKKFIIFEGHYAFNANCRRKNGWFMQCYVCNTKFRYLADLKYHIRRHLNKEPDLKPTDSTINGGSNRSIHTQKEESSVGSQCHICQRNFRKSFHLNEHMLAHSTEVSKKGSGMNGATKSSDRLASTAFECQICKIDYADETALEIHKATHVNNRLKCENCNLTFTTEISLRFHRKLFHKSDVPNKPEKLQCDICQAKFSFSGNLARHKLVHTVGEVECEICHIRFTKKSLELHEKQVHPEIIEKHGSDDDGCKDVLDEPQENERDYKITSTMNYSCDQCDRSFKTISHLQMHSKSHRQYSCFCDKTFKTAAGLSSHSRSHSFECYVCKAEFTSTEDLGTHIRQHICVRKMDRPGKCSFIQLESREITRNTAKSTIGVGGEFKYKKYKPEFLSSKKDIRLVNVKDEPATIEKIKLEKGTETSPTKDSRRITIELKYSEQSNSQSIYDEKELVYRSSSNRIVDLALSSDSEEVLIVEQKPDTTMTFDDDSKEVVDISSESDVDELELFHCYFCNETFRSLDALGVHVKKCAFCP